MYNYLPYKCSEIDIETLCKAKQLGYKLYVSESDIGTIVNFYYFKPNGKQSILYRKITEMTKQIKKELEKLEKRGGE